MMKFSILLVYFACWQKAYSADEGGMGTLSYVWNVFVEDIKLMDEGGSMISPNVTTWNNRNKESWLISFYRDGGTTNGDSSIYLRYLGSNTVNVSYTLYVENSDSALTVTKSQNYSFGPDRRSSGKKDFIKSFHLLDPEEGFIKEGKIVIGVRLPSDPKPLGIDGESMVAHKWLINVDDLSVEPGTPIRSAHFATFDKSTQALWELKLFPNGINRMRSDYSALYLCNRGNTATKTTFELSIVNENKEDTVVGSWTRSIRSGYRAPRMTEFILAEDLTHPAAGFVNDDGMISIMIRLSSDPFPVDWKGIDPCLTSLDQGATDSTTETPSSLVSMVTTNPTVIKTTPANSVVNAPLMNLYRSTKVKVGEVEMTIEHVSSFETIQKLISALTRVTNGTTASISSNP